MRKRLPDHIIDIDCRDAAATDARAAALVTALVGLQQTNSDAREMILGVDNVGMDSDWNPQRQSVACSMAMWSGLHVAAHFGESWREGDLLSTLEELA
jgi:hypothetical protein